MRNEPVSCLYQPWAPRGKDDELSAQDLELRWKHPVFACKLEERVEEIRRPAYFWLRHFAECTVP